MTRSRPSRPEELPRLKELWKLAFGDEDAYIDHFFAAYYTPERVLVLEESGVVQAMTAWFDMPLVLADGTRVPSAYLYAVATHPDCRGRGMAGALLSFAGRWLKERKFDCLTTVPARPDLHGFFGRNGFEEWFVLKQWEYEPKQEEKQHAISRVDSMGYAAVREQALKGMEHTAYSPKAMDYQAGVCDLSGGGLYETGEESCACVEVAGDQVFVKELLAPPEERNAILAAIAKTHPGRRYWVRAPWDGQGERWEFAMIQWLTSRPDRDSGGNAYLGLAFD